MLDFQQKRKLRTVFYSRITVGILVIVTLLSVRSVWLVYKKERESASLRDDARMRLIETQKNQNELTSRLENLKTEQGIETEIRSKFNVSKSGENIIVIVDGDVATHTPVKERNFWRKLLDWFL